MKTLEAINSLMAKFQVWGMLDNLTENERQIIEINLKEIAGTAIMEAQNKIQNTLPKLYNEITKPLNN